MTEPASPTAYDIEAEIMHADEETDDDIDETVLNDLSRHTLSSHDLMSTDGGASSTSVSSFSYPSAGDDTATTTSTAPNGSPKPSSIAAKPGESPTSNTAAGDVSVESSSNNDEDDFDEYPESFYGLDGTDHTPASSSTSRTGVARVSKGGTPRKLERNKRSSIGSNRGGGNAGDDNFNHTISMVRIMFITTLFTFAAIVSNVVFIIAHNKEQATFESKIHMYGQQFQSEIQNQLYAYYWLADSFVSSIVTPSSGDSAPSTTNAEVIPDFAYQCEQIHDLLHTSVIWWSPVLYGSEERSTFESYAILQQTNPSLYAISTASSSSSADTSNSDSATSSSDFTQVIFYDTDRTISQGIYRMENGTAVSEGNGEGTYSNDFISAPIWQLSIEGGNDQVQNAYSIRMFDQYSETIRQHAIDQMLTGGLGGKANASSTKASAVLSDILSTKVSDDSIHESFKTPTSAWYFPVTDGEDQDKTVIGAVTFHLHWQTIVERTIHKLGLMENESLGPIMILLLENTCGSVHSFEIRRRKADDADDVTNYDEEAIEVTYLGNSDTYHDDGLEAPHFDYEDVTNFVIIQNSAYDASNAANDDADIDAEHSDAEEVVTARLMGDNHEFIKTTSTCDSYRIRVYPTIEMKTTYITTRPELLRTGIAMLFLFTCCVFIGYDCIQERKNRQLEQSAQKTNAIVDSLFPSNVRDRIYEQHNQQPKKQTYNPRVLRASLTKMQNPKLRLNSFLAGDEDDGANDNKKPDSNRNNGGRRRSSINMKKAYFMGGNNASNGGMTNAKATLYSEATSRLSRSYSQKAIMDAIHDIKTLEKYMPTSDPIADLFPRATVMSAGMFKKVRLN